MSDSSHHSSHRSPRRSFRRRARRFLKHISPKYLLEYFIEDARRFVVLVVGLAALFVIGVSLFSFVKKAGANTPAEPPGSSSSISSSFSAESSSSAAGSISAPVEIPDTTEYITLSDEEDVYALSRLLAYGRSQNEYIYREDYDFMKEDIAELELPSDAPVDDITAAIDYLSKANFKLAKDMELVFQAGTGKDFFMGIGNVALPYSGIFNGNNKTITLTQAENVRTADPYYINRDLALFSNTDGAHLKNIHIKVESDIVYNGVNSTYNTAYLGILAGSLTNSIADSCSVELTDVTFGAPNLILGENTPKGKEIPFGAGVIAGRMEASTITNCSVLASNSTIRLDVGLDKRPSFYAGGFVGNAIGSEDSRCVISDSTLNFRNSELYSNGFLCRSGGLVGSAQKTTIRDSSVTFLDSSVKAAGDTVYSKYAALSVGGILGFSAAGNANDNSQNVGNLGCEVLNCHFTSSNSAVTDVLYVQARKGGELAVGGLVGVAFNNFKIKNSTANFENANITAYKTTEEDAAAFGTSVGGIIARLEHSGEVYECSVTGNYLTLLSKSPENDSYAGGIVGVDIGPYNYDLVSINKCSFDGSGTSTIKIEAGPNIAANNKFVCVGGIVGNGTYKIRACSAKNVTIANSSGRIANPAYCGGIIGRYYAHSLWSSNQYFEAGTPGIVDCTTEGIIFENSENVLAGEIYGDKEF